ncbi:MAG: hypothetical protein IKI75_11890 [Lachnospiraceae bacterium]|nr:hypothetical protein [Lachnospiraceae bacterium]
MKKRNLKISGLMLAAVLCIGMGGCAKEEADPRGKIGEVEEEPDMHFLLHRF